MTIDFHAQVFPEKTAAKTTKYLAEDPILKRKKSIETPKIKFKVKVTENADQQ